MSGKLRCSAERCANNVNKFCVAASIHVNGSSAHSSSETDCDTFLGKSDIYSTSHFTNRNLSGEFAQLFSGESVEMSPDIACEAENCIYNVNRLCSADFVQIHGEEAHSSEHTQCETFKEHSQ
ncbi:DUF1540 domain-containing protein [Clostridium sp. OS1-26]|uniref:DUF1540 domain-containing protein n=1 Tax=Clostridium sp. OS1-26 TaxID=3070681 RepID=UPI0027E0D7CA|nr:DUF1540 domain-containing protein [Clostridium sp. OS1-26]WML36151.1 DUF1540 domain-containing protein [Clostridium sp. OS1-26]